MRPIFLLIPVLAVAACSTPRESCIYLANEQLRELEYKIDRAQGNVDRGYALSNTTRTREIEATCSRELQDGTVETYDCDRTETIRDTTPVTIDIADERRKLAGLKSQLAPLLAATQRAEQQCRAIHPE